MVSGREKSLCLQRSQINTRSELTVLFYSVNISDWLLSLLLPCQRLRNSRVALNCMACATSQLQIPTRPDSGVQQCTVLGPARKFAGSLDVGWGSNERWHGDFAVLFVCFPGSLAKILGDHMPGRILASLNGDRAGA